MKNNIFLKAIFLAVMLGTLGILSVSAKAEGDQYDALREKWYNIVGGGDYDELDEYVKKKVQSSVDNTNKYLSTLIASPKDRLWEDNNLDYATDGSGLNTTFSRLRTMALAYTYKSSSLKGDEKLLAALLDSLTYLSENHYNDQVEYVNNGSANWYNWEIGVPTSLVDILVLLYDEMPQSLREDYVSAILHFNPDAKKQWFDQNTTSTGANRTWKCIINVLCGILSRDGELIKYTVSLLDDVFLYADEYNLDDGFYTDGSYVQHAVYPYTGGYGVNTFRDSLKLITFLDGSEFAVDEKNKEIVKHWAYNAFLPVIYNGNLMSMVRGREITRYNASDMSAGANVLSNIYELSKILPAEEKEYLQSIIKTNVLIDENHKKSFLNALSVSSEGEARKMIEDNAILPAADNHYAHVFAGMDRAVFKGNDFAVGLSMFSNRIASYESITNDNKRGYYTSHGALFLHNSDVNQFTDNYWPVVNPEKIPGTTVTSIKLPDAFHGDKPYLSSYSWAGGATQNDSIMAAGMILEDYKQNDISPLVCNKSWFIFDGQIICLGGGITSNVDGVSVTTIVENRVIDETDAVVTDTGKKNNGADYQLKGAKTISIENRGDCIGYFFPDNQNILLSLNQRTGNWYENSPKSYNPNSSVTLNFAEISIDHGEKPQNETYSYIILPGADEKAIEEYSRDCDIKILDNNNSAASVLSPKFRVQATNFFSDEKYISGRITSSGPASVIMQEDGDKLYVSVSDPTQTKRTVHLDIDAKILSSVDVPHSFNVDATDNKLSLDVNLEKTGGKTLTAVFEINDMGKPISRVKADAFENMKNILKNNTFFCVGSSLMMDNGMAQNIYPESIDVGVVSQNGVAMIPIRFFCDKYGAYVRWNSNDGSVDIMYNNKTYTVMPNSSLMYQNGEACELKENSVLINDRMYLPLRDISEIVFNKVVSYDRGIIAIGEDGLGEDVFNYMKSVLAN